MSLSEDRIQRLVDVVQEVVEWFAGDESKEPLTYERAYWLAEVRAELREASRAVEKGLEQLVRTERDGGAVVDD